MMIDQEKLIKTVIVIIMMISPHFFDKFHIKGENVAQIYAQAEQQSQTVMQAGHITAKAPTADQVLDHFVISAEDMSQITPMADAMGIKMDNDINPVAK